LNRQYASLKIMLFFFKLNFDNIDTT